MKVFLSICAFIVFVTVLRGQAKVQWGEDVKLKSGDYYSGIITEKDSALFLLKLRTDVFRNEGFYADFFDSHTLSRGGSIPLLLKDARIENEGKLLVPELEKVLVVNGMLCVFISAYDRGADQNIAYVATYDKNSRQDGFFELDRISNAKRFNLGQFDFVTSPDGKKVMVLRKRPYNKKENARFDLKIFDADFNLIHSKSLLLPYKDRNFEIHRHALDNNGNVVLMARIEREERPPGLPWYYYSLMEFLPADSNKTWEYDIELDSRIITDVDFILNDHNKILVPGFYAEPGREGVQGTFFMSIDRDRHMVESSAVKPFEKTLALDFINEKKYEKGQGLPGFNINHTVSLPDGGLYVISEQYYVSEVCGRDGRGFISCNYYYYYNSIVVFRIDETGGIRWNSVIPKFQFSINDEGFYSSYTMGLSNGKLHFVYNDHPKNIEVQKLQDFKMMSRPSSSQVVHVTVYPDGTFTKEPLFSNKDEKLILRPKFSSQFKESEIIVSGIPKNNWVRLGRIIFE